MAMKVNDLIEFLEYSPCQAPVSVAVVGPDGTVMRHDAPLFLMGEERVYLVIDQRSEVNESVGTPTEEITLSDFERPQLFGHQFMLLHKTT